ncbi:MAG: copper resistance CopC family protein [Stellaceae bacterium]
MSRYPLIACAFAASLFAAAPALAHAFLDYASPAVGSTVPAAPANVALWFTEHIEPAFSTATVTDGAGQRVNRGDAHVAADDPAELQLDLKPLPPGTYTVHWHVVSVDTHTTAGTFSFDVGK